ncbi:MAG: SRPBCC family protein [Gemmatimonadota bacterium]|nr:MAG: SRPBCC family protein [Gemmatimonadota bacterium]
MLKWVLILLGLLAALVAGPFVAGMFLPARHVASSSITLPQPPDSVWAVIRDLGSYPDWWSDIKSSVPDEQAEDEEIWIQKDAQGHALPLLVVQSAPPTLLVTKIAAEKLPYSGVWTYEIEQTANGSRVTLTEDGEVFNPIFRLVARLFLGHHTAVDRCLRALGQRFGEQVVPKHNTP